MKKRMLVIALKDKAEALRVANGLSIIHEVQVAVLGDLDKNDPKVQEQLEAMEFAEIPLIEVSIEDNYGPTIGGLILWSDGILVI